MLMNCDHTSCELFIPSIHYTPNEDGALTWYHSMVLPMPPI